MLVGGVRANFKKMAPFPARCDRCRNLVGVNVLAVGQFAEPAAALR